MYDGANPHRIQIDGYRVWYDNRLHIEANDIDDVIKIESYRLAPTNSNGGEATQHTVRTNTTAPQTIKEGETKTATKTGKEVSFDIPQDGFYEVTIEFEYNFTVFQSKFDPSFLITPVTGDVIGSVPNTNDKVFEIKKGRYTAKIDNSTIDKIKEQLQINDIEESELQIMVQYKLLGTEEEKVVENFKSENATLKERLEALQGGAFEKNFVYLFLKAGDYANNVMSKVVGQDLTIDKIIFNKVDALDANFFKQGSAQNNAVSSVVEQVVNQWYSFFRSLAIVAYLIGLLGIGIRILAGSTGSSQAKYKDELGKWVVGVALLFFMPYIMKYAFMINETIVAMVNQGLPSTTLGSNFGDGRQEISATEIEFRSPEYVTEYTGQLAFGGDEVNEIYYSKIDSYKANADIMRVMRAYAGITGRFIYMFLWFIMLGQLIVLLVMYYKRYFMLALLITLFPVIMIFYLIDMVKGKQGKALSNWIKEFIINVFVQSIHAITYVIVAGVSLSQITTSISTGNGANWLLMIVSITFLFKGEEILRKIFGVDGGATMGTAIATATMLRSGVDKVKKNFKEDGGESDYVRKQKSKDNSSSSKPEVDKNRKTEKEIAAGAKPRGENYNPVPTKNQLNNAIDEGRRDGKEDEQGSKKGTPKGSNTGSQSGAPSSQGSAGSQSGAESQGGASSRQGSAESQGGASSGQSGAENQGGASSGQGGVGTQGGASSGQGGVGSQGGAPSGQGGVGTQSGIPSGQSGAGSQDGEGNGQNEDTGGNQGGTISGQGGNAIGNLGEELSGEEEATGGSQDGEPSGQDMEWDIDLEDTDIEAQLDHLLKEKEQKTSIDEEIHLGRID